MMSASVDTTIVIWDLKGEVLAAINTNQMTNSHVAVSPCGRFVFLKPLVFKGLISYIFIFY